MLDRRVWWCTGALVVGIGAALLTGSGIAAADTGDSGDSDGGSKTSQESESAASETSTPGSAAAAAKRRPPRHTPVATLGDAGARIKVGALTRAASSVGRTRTAERPARADRSTTVRKRRTSLPQVIPRTVSTIDTSVKKVAADPIQPDHDDPEITEPKANTLPTDSPSIAAPETTTQSSAEAPMPVATTAVRSLAPPVANAPPAAIAPRSPGPIATLVLNALSSLGWSPRAEVVAVFPALAPWYGASASFAAGDAAAVTDPTLLAAAQDSGPLLPGSSNGVTGVQVGHSQLEIPVGPNGYSASADWYFPTQADGSVQAQGSLWLQHGFGANNSFYASLATQLAQQTNSIVVVPTINSLPSLFCPGCWLNGAEMQQAVATLFLDDQEALNASAIAAGYQGTLPTTFIMAGHSAGGGFATAVAAYTVANGAAADDLLAVVMFDGVAGGVLDGSGSFTQQLAELDTLNIPVYQIAAPAQAWNAFGSTTNALLAARPDQFDGVVLVGGSHVDSMLGDNPIINFVLQLVTRPVPAGNTAATYTLSTGWINDIYVGATPEAPQYGFYAGPNQQIIMGDAAAVGLPSPFADQLSPVDALLKSVFDFFGGLFGVPASDSNVQAVSDVTSVVTPPMTNGVTGVKTGTSTLNIPCGNGCPAFADWYFPTQADGTVQANGIIWLQHGGPGFNAEHSHLAIQIAQQTNSIVVAPDIIWLDTPLCPGCNLGTTEMQEAVASMFLGDRAALNISANAAGFEGTLPEEFLLTGHSAGGGFATAVGALTVDNGAAENLLGIVMFDGVPNAELLSAALAKLDSRGIPDYQIAAPPHMWNGWGESTELISTLHMDQFTGVMIDNGSHFDSVDGNWLAELAGALYVKPSPPGGKAAVSTFATGWINDMYAGKGPTDPVYGIYGNPNDGTYVANQPIVMGEAGATTLPAPPPVNVDPLITPNYLGTWYEQGSVKQFFSIGLVNTKAQYSLNPDGTIRVENSGNYFGPDGPESRIVGSAVPVNSYNTRLNVGFFFGTPSADEPGNYWILDYAPDYSWAIVSDSSGFSGFILTRDQTIPEAEYDALVARARELGVWGPITPTQQYPTPSTALVPGPALIPDAVAV